MALPAAFPTKDPTRTFNQRGDLARPEARYAECGTWWNNQDPRDLLTGQFPAVTQIVDFTLGGADPDPAVGSLRQGLYRRSRQIGAPRAWRRRKNRLEALAAHHQRRSSRFLRSEIRRHHPNLHRRW